MKALDRRTFLRQVAAASAAAAGSAHLSAQDVLAQRQGGPAWRRVPCRLCGVGCGLLVGIERGRATAVRGDPDAPPNEGLACVKGYHSIQALYGRDRLLRARIRRDGTFADVPMQEALDLVARQLRDTIERHGARSVGVYGSAQWTAADALVAERLFRDAIGTTNVATSAGLHTASAGAGSMSTFGTDGAVGCYEDIDNADVFVLWNINMAESDPVLFSRILARRRRNPAVRIIELATRTTRTSYASDAAFLYAPHAEAAILNAMAQECVSRGWVQRDFLTRHVAFKRGRTAMGAGPPDGTSVADDATDATWDEYVAFLAAYTPENAQRVSGLGSDTIRWIASQYGDQARKVLTVWGAAVNGHAHGTWLNTLLYNLHLLTGRIAQPGNGALCITGQPGGADLVQAHPAGATPLSLFRALERGDLRFLWVQATNPMVSLPNLMRYRRAVERRNCFLVVSDVYPTPTTDVADVVLPAAMWFEREGAYVNNERRVQHFARLVPPPGVALSDARQMIEVARRLGYAGQLPGPDDNITDWTWDGLRTGRQPHRSLPALAELRVAAGVQWPSIGGREVRWRFAAAHDPSADRTHGDYDFYGHDDHRAWIWLRPHEPAAETPDAEYPFWFTTGRVLEHWGTGTMTRRVPTLHRAVPRAYVELNRADARQLGVRDGERVRLVSRRGALVMAARVDYRSQPPRGMLFAPSFDEGSPVNQLTLDVACPISGQPDYKCAVRVERLSPGGAS